ncbi:AEC family transporter [Paenibacillus methanolicus]|uniref:AEC family transporter n=1 Tax=Paenibacillus methanolicus TaxID=582686 RepID=A0A5S5BWI2_9BACL|nr:AEC family transporter [Paenibacillus methanolicus]TYP71364.1 hypothetical protein BCM02_110318 [Paenibacillus methanolicus]
MSVLTTIVWNNVLPLSVMIALGIVLQRAFTLDIRTLSKLNFYLFSPAMIFQLLYTTSISAGVALQVLLFLLIFMVLQYGAAEAFVRLRGHRGGMRAAMRNSVLFYNSANYAIPLNGLVFANNPFTLSVQILVMMTQSLLPNTYGIYSVNAHKSSLRGVMRTIIQQPVIYAIPLGFALHQWGIELPKAVEAPLGYLANAFIGTALITLGVQLGNMKWSMKALLHADVWLASGLRLVAGPLLAAAVVWAMGLDGLMAQALIVSSAVPTSLSSVLLAVEFDNEPEYASQAVLLSTVLSIATVTFVIFALDIQI